MRLSRTITVPPETLAALRGVAAQLDPDRTGPLARRDDRPAGHLSLFGSTFVEGDPAVAYAMHAADVAALERSVRLGKMHADLLLVSLHVHEEGPDAATPPAFLVELAHRAVAAGADVVFGHGVHRLWPVELHGGRPIYYGLGNACFSDLQEPLHEDLHDDAAGLVGAPAAVPGAPVDADVTLALAAQGFDDARFYEGAVGEVTFAGGAATRVRLHPLDLGYGDPLTTSGVPRLAAPERARAVLARVDALSRPFRTAVASDGVVSAAPQGEAVAGG